MMSAGILSAYVLVLATAQEPDAVILGLSEETDVLRRLNLLNDVSLLEPGLAPQDVLTRLTNIAQPDMSTVAELTAKADAADQLESDFKTDAAKAIRDEIIDAYNRHAIADTRIQQLAARVLHGRGAASLSNGREHEAIRDFVTGLRRFPNIAFDTRRYSPPVQQAFQKASSELRRVPQTSLSITTTRPGTIMLDGRPIGDAGTTLTRDVARGRYLLWVRDVSGHSLMHPIEVGLEPVTVNVDFELERQLAWTPALTTHCAAACNATLSALAQRAGVSRAIGIRVTSRGTTEALSVTARGETHVQELRELDAILNPPFIVTQPATHISPWSYVPAGVGQFAQRRPIVGGIVAGLTAAAVTWNVMSALQRRPGHDDDPRTAQNISASVVVGVVLAGVAEAIVHDLTHETAP